MFSYLGYGERAGSGLYNIKAIWNEKGWKVPEIEERLNPNRTTLILSTEKRENNNSTINITENNNISLNNTENQILKLLEQNPNMTQKEIADNIKITERAVSKVMKELKTKNIITRIGSNKKGYWKINL